MNGINGQLMFQSDRMLQLDQLGVKLNVAIDCPVTYPAYDKNMFRCHCGVVFPMFIVGSRTEEQLRELHLIGRTS